MEDRQIKVTKFGIRRSISASELEVYQRAGWERAQGASKEAYRKEREKVARKERNTA